MAAAAAAAASAAGDETKAIEIFKIKKLINSLDRARGNGTSMISLILPPKSQIAQANKMLADEYGTASNIKSRVNRQSVLSAITSTQQRLKNWTKCPENGLVVFVGDILTEDGKEKKLAIDFEPFKPINTSLYLCDNRFHTEGLSELLSDDESFGFIVMDGSGALYGRVCGSAREILHRFTVELPKKHGRGGQSALRFARLRLEKRHNYVRKVAESAVTQFITSDLPNVKGLVLAGSAEFKNDLQKSDLLDPRLKAVVINVVDVSYGGENGFNQAIELSSEVLSNVKLVEEKKLIGGFFDEIARDTGMFCFGIKDVMTGLEMSALEKLILWEDLPLLRFELRNPSTGEASVMFLNPEEAEDRTKFRDAATGVDLDISDHSPFVEWMAEHFKEFGVALEFVTDRSSEGAQFVKGFGGIGGLMRWKVDFVELDEFMEDDDDFI